MLHPHIWVRLLSSQLLGTLFASRSPDELVSTATADTGVGSEEGEERDLARPRRKRKGRRQKREAGGGEAGQPVEKDSHYLMQNTIDKVVKELVLLRIHLVEIIHS